MDRRRALTATGGLVTGAFLSLAGPSPHGRFRCRPGTGLRGRRAVHEPGDLAGLRGHRRHPRRHHLLRLRLDDALLTGRAVLRSYDLVNREIATADIRPGAARPGTFSHSTDGTTFTRLGPAFSLGNDRHFFMGYRFALFNHATQALGGAVRVPRFELSAR